MDTKNTALAAITATYDDSDDDEYDDEETEDQANIEANNKNALSDTGSQSNSPAHVSVDNLGRRRHTASETSADEVRKSPVAFHRELLENSSIESLLTKLPEESLAPCPQSLQEKVEHLFNVKKSSGRNMCGMLQRRKDVRNPSIYEKLVSYLDIDEKGTNFPEEIYNSTEWTSESFYEELSKRQMDLMNKRDKEKKLEVKTKVELITGTKSSLVAETKKLDQSSLSGEPRKKKSKWDVGADQIQATGSKVPAVSSIVVAPQVVIAATSSNHDRSKSPQSSSSSSHRYSHSQPNSDSRHSSHSQSRSKRSGSHHRDHRSSDYRSSDYRRDDHHRSSSSSKHAVYSDYDTVKKKSSSRHRDRDDSHHRYYD